MLSKGKRRIEDIISPQRINTLKRIKRSPITRTNYTRKSLPSARITSNNDRMANIKSRIAAAKKYFEDVKANRKVYTKPYYNKKLHSLVSAVKSIYPKQPRKILEHYMHSNPDGGRYVFSDNILADNASELYYTMRQYPHHDTTVENATKVKRSLQTIPKKNTKRNIKKKFKT